MTVRIPTFAIVTLGTCSNLKCSICTYVFRLTNISREKSSPRIRYISLYLNSLLLNMSLKHNSYVSLLGRLIWIADATVWETEILIYFWLNLWEIGSTFSSIIYPNRPRFFSSDLSKVSMLSMAEMIFSCICFLELCSVTDLFLHNLTYPSVNDMCVCL